MVLKPQAKRIFLHERYFEVYYWFFFFGKNENANGSNNLFMDVCWNLFFAGYVNEIDT